MCWNVIQQHNSVFHIICHDENTMYLGKLYMTCADVQPLLFLHDRDSSNISNEHKYICMCVCVCYA